MGQLVPLQLQNKPKHSSPMGFQPHLFYSRDEGSNSTAWVSMAEMFSSSSQGFPSPCSHPTVMHKHCCQAGPTLPLSIAMDSTLRAASQYQFDHYNSIKGGDPILATSFQSPCPSKERDICYQSAGNSVFISRCSPCASCHPHSVLLNLSEVTRCLLKVDGEELAQQNLAQPGHFVNSFIVRGKKVWKPCTGHKQVDCT